MWLNDIIDRIKLPFRKEKELFSSLYRILGFYPHDIRLYKQALLHKSVGRRNEKGRPLNNERLEFLGDAILDAVVGDIVFRHFDGKREGFLTNTRSKLVSRDTLGKLSKEMGIPQLIMSAGHSTSHNSYMNGNAFEALVGAIYLDRGYGACMRFMEKRILAQLINIDKVAYKEVNFKSKLLEWSQKNRVKMEFRDLEQTRDNNNNPVFTTQVFIEGLEGCTGTGYSKKESQQYAAKETLQRLRREPQFIDAVFAAKGDRTKMEEEPVMIAPDVEKLMHDEQGFIIEKEQETSSKEQEQYTSPNKLQSPQLPQSVIQQSLFDDEEMTLDDIKMTPQEKTREDIIAEAEAAAFAEEENKD
jgi:ribonuclease-3